MLFSLKLLAMKIQCSAMKDSLTNPSPICYIENKLLKDQECMNNYSFALFHLNSNVSYYHFY